MNKIQEKNWDSEEYYYKLGNAYRKQNNWKMALEAYSEAIEKNPESPDVHAKEMLLKILNFRCKDLLNP